MELTCENCNGCMIITEECNILCIECGLISSVNDMSDNSYNEISRCGPSNDEEINPFIKMSTFTNKGSKSFITRDGSVMKNDIFRLHVQNSYNSKQKSFDQVVNIIDNCVLCPMIKNDSKNIYIYFVKSKIILRGLNRLGLIACCIYFACHKNGIYMTPTEICEGIGLEGTKNFNKSFKIFESIYKKNEIKDNDENTNENKNFEDSISSYILRFLSMLELDNIIKNTYEINSVSNEILINCSNEDLRSCSPKNIACSIIYLSLLKKDIKISKKIIINNFNISYPTLNKIIEILENKNFKDTKLFESN